MDIFASRCAIAEEAEKSAITAHWSSEPGLPFTPNPFPEGSDAHKVWASHFDRKLASLESRAGTTC
jgi:hypothetical protein